MKSLFKSILLGTLLLTIALADVRSASASGSFDVYLSAPGSQSTIYTNTLTETFSEFNPGVYTSNLVGTIGTYQLSSSTKLAIMANDQYGSGTGNYAALGAQSGSASPVTLLLNSPQSYFGLSWNAGDQNNTLSFYNGSQLVGLYSTASVLNLLKNTTVTALNGQTYQSSAYYGQPGTHQDAGEPFAFINFTYTAGTFDRVVFGNSNTTGTGFESDNHTIRTNAPAPDSSFVSVGSAATPEPGATALLIGLGLSGATLAIRRRKPRK